MKTTLAVIIAQLNATREEVDHLVLHCPDGDEQHCNSLQELSDDLNAAINSAVAASSEA